MQHQPQEPIDSARRSTRQRAAPGAGAYALSGAGTLLNLNNAAVSRHHGSSSLVSRNWNVNMWSRLDANLPSIKAALSALVNCDAAETALNRNSMEGLSTVIFGVTMQPGDEVVVSEWDYPSALRGWQQRAAREGIRIVTARFDPLDDDDAIVSTYSNALTPRTRVMQLTHMLHWTGRVPAERLCELARERGVASLVDGAQTFARIPVRFSGRSAATSSSPVSTRGWVLPLETAC